MRLLNIIFLCTICFSCESTSDLKSETIMPDPIPSDSIPIDSITMNPEYTLLFIGNSLTYSNDLPSLVKRAAKIKNINIETKMIARGNYGIIDHWNDKSIQKEMNKE